MLARRFLWLIVAAVVLVLAAAVAYRLFGPQLLKVALVPSARFADSRTAPPLDYARAGSWDANPALPDDPARWRPARLAAGRPRAAVFFVTPTAFFGRDRWTMPWGDAATDRRRALYVRNLGSAFNGVGPVWAPKYRQATFGAFLTDRPDAARALDLAYSDVVRAFAAFVAAVPPGTPVVLAGHSQGARHLIRLVAEHVAGTPLAKRVVAVYAVGWPVAAADLAAMDLPACAGPTATLCVLSWRSYAEPAEVVDFRDPAGRGRRSGGLVCTNPLTGSETTAVVPASANAGSLMPAADEAHPVLGPGAVGAQCRGDYLSIGAPPAEFDRYVLPGNNYHVYDINLFWANVRADAERRVAAWIAAGGRGAAAAERSTPGAGREARPAARAADR
ncbi:MAG: DUF3089 domain-containing protein [Sphingomonadaceae bacterium]|nr:DUF3089 domain-containing protein [Sphingomonadaceae bacterium]